MSSSPLSKIFKAYDVRGLVPDELDRRRAYAIGIGFGRFLSTGTKPARVLVGHDMRSSAGELSAALRAGVASLGIDVVDLGLCSTDLLYYASGSQNAPAVMLTASHNPGQYNGMKFCRSGARPVGADSGLEDICRYGEEVYDDVPDGTALDEAIGAVTAHKLDLLGNFASHVRSFVDAGELTDLRVVADTANGMGGLVAPVVFADLPFHLDLLYGKLDGSFPNHPADPIQVENLADLRSRVLDSGADVGLAFDGDADRVFLVDERGEPLSGSTTTAIVASVMLERHPGATILHNCICSKAVPEIITESGGTPVRTRVGHSYIKAVMADTGAVFGGEHSGHYYFKDNYRADSGIIAALVVLEMLCRTKSKLSELRRRFERYADSGERNTPVADPQAVIEAVTKKATKDGATVDDFDGLTADYGSWWFNLRPSNTEPLLRLNVEAADGDACAERTDEVLALIHEFDTSTKGASS